MLHLTESATLKVKEMLAEVDHPEKTYLRMGVQAGGCTGFSYSMGFDEEVHESDKTWNEQGIAIVIDKNDEPLLKGTVVDYKESMMGGGFQIDNPNATLTCGCGSSFRTATEAGSPDDC